MTVAQGHHSRGQSRCCSGAQALSSAWLQGHRVGRTGPGRLPGGMASPPETPPATPLRPLQQFLLAARGNKALPGLVLATVLAISGTAMRLPALCQPQARAKPERQSPRHLHHDTHKSFTTPAVACLRGVCLSFPPLQTNSSPASQRGTAKLVQRSLGGTSPHIHPWVLPKTCPGCPRHSSKAQVLSPATHSILPHNPLRPWLPIQAPSPPALT